VFGESQQHEINESVVQTNKRDLINCISAWVQDNLHLKHNIFSVEENVENYDAIQAETALAFRRRYILIIVADSAPDNAFVSYNRQRPDRA
jgi:hypothetical protein